MDEPTDLAKTVILKRDLPAPSFSHLTDPTWVSPEERQRRDAERSGGGLLGGGLGAAGGALLGKHLAGGPGAAFGGTLGGILGLGAGRDIAQAHNDHLTVKRDQAVADRERAQEHRKELLDMKDTKKKEAGWFSGGTTLNTPHGPMTLPESKDFDPQKHRYAASPNGVHAVHADIADAFFKADEPTQQEMLKQHLGGKIRYFGTSAKKEASTLHGVMYSAMANELAAMDQEKVAINIGAIGSALGGLASRAASAAPRVMGALENVGGRLVGGAQTGIRGLAARSTQGSAVTNAAGHLLGGINSAKGAVGGAQNLNRLVGGGAALGTAALGTGLAAKALAPAPRPVTLQMR